MTQDEIYALYDAMITAECSNDYSAAFVINEVINNLTLK